MGKKGRTPKALSTRGLGQHAENLKIKGHATLLEQKFDFQSAIAETRIPQKLLALSHEPCILLRKILSCELNSLKGVVCVSRSAFV